MNRRWGRNPFEIPPGFALIPEDFAERLEALKEAAELSWEGMAVCLGVDSRQLLRWRKGGAPNGGAMLSLVRLARRIPGGLDMLVEEDQVFGRNRRA